MEEEHPQSYKARNEAAAESPPATSFVLNRANGDIGQWRRKRIDEKTRRRMIELYREGLSERKVAAELKVDPTTVHDTLVKREEPRRSISEANMKYPKTDFSGDPVEQARMLGFIEDCGVGYARKQLHIQSTTTHPAQIGFFSDTLGGYGYINNISCYNKSYSLYQWKIYVFVKLPSFGFVVEYKRYPMKFLAEIANNRSTYDYIGGLSGAEGWVGIEFNKGNPRSMLCIYNDNRRILEWAQTAIGGWVCRHDNHYQLQLRGEDAIEVLRKLPIMHEEKAAAKEIILRHYENRGIGLAAFREYREFRRRIDDEVRLCTMQARLNWIRRHGRPHPDDPDRTIPPN